MENSEKTGIWLALAEGETVAKPFVFRNHGTHPSTDEQRTKKRKIGNKAWISFYPTFQPMSCSWDRDDKIEERS